jgi:hypothetical protein
VDKFRTIDSSFKKKKKKKDDDDDDNDDDDDDNNNNNNTSWGQYSGQILAPFLNSKTITQTFGLSDL